MYSKSSKAVYLFICRVLSFHCKDFSLCITIFQNAFSWISSIHYHKDCGTWTKMSCWSENRIAKRDATHPTSRIQKVAGLGLKFKSLGCWSKAHSSKPHCSFFWSSKETVNIFHSAWCIGLLGEWQRSSEVQTIEMKSCIKLHKKYVYWSPISWRCWGHVASYIIYGHIVILLLLLLFTFSGIPYCLNKWCSRQYVAWMVQFN